MRKTLRPEGNRECLTSKEMNCKEMNSVIIASLIVGEVAEVDED